MNLELNLEEIGKRLKDIREFLGFTQNHVAMELNETQVSVSRLEKGSDLGSKKLLMFLKFYSQYVKIDIIFQDHYDLCKLDEDFLVKDIHLDSILVEKLIDVKKNTTEELERMQARMNSQLNSLIALASKEKFK